MLHLELKQDVHYIEQPMFMKKAINIGLLFCHHILNNIRNAMKERSLDLTTVNHLQSSIKLHVGALCKQKWPINPEETRERIELTCLMINGIGEEDQSTSCCLINLDNITTFISTNTLMEIIKITIRRIFDNLNHPLKVHEKWIIDQSKYRCLNALYEMREYLILHPRKYPTKWDPIPRMRSIVVYYNNGEVIESRLTIYSDG